MGVVAPEEPSSDRTTDATIEAGRWLKQALAAVLQDEQDLSRVSALRRSLADAVARLP
jgi:hypothetical protein